MEVLAFRENSIPKCCAYVNYGNASLSAGDRLKVVRLEESLVDEATGLELGAIEQSIVVLEVVEMLDKLSKAKVLSGDIRARGQIARIIFENGSEGQQTGLGAQRERVGRKI